jgi:chromosome segregation ATPase
MSQLLTPDKLQEKVSSIIARHSRVLRRKSELSGELKSKKDELAALVREIDAAGYNPKTLVEERNKTQKELEEMLEVYDKQLTEVEGTFAEYDRK